MKTWICTNCKSRIHPKRKACGRFITEFFLWMTPIICVIVLYSHCFSEYGWSPEEFANNISEIVSVGSQQPAYLNYDPSLHELFNYTMLVEASFGLWIVALIYTLWRFLSKKRRVCTNCGSENCFVPINSPEGKRIVSESEATNTSSGTEQDGFLSQLEKLGELEEKGLLTKGEFQTQKQKLLS